MPRPSWVLVLRRIKDQNVADILEAVCWFRGYPVAFRTDQGPEFTDCPVIAIWRKDYNEVRPHSSLSQRKPAEFVAALRNDGVLPKTTGAICSPTGTLQSNDRP